MTSRIIIGDCRDILRTLPDQSVHCVVTSPPYFGLRDYGVDGQIGLEPSPDAFVAEMVAVFRDVRRVLRDDGTLWLNLGDSYCSTDKWGGGGNIGKNTVAPDGTVPSWAGRAKRPHMEGLKPKDLIGIPWRVAFALQQPFYSGRITREIDRVWLAAMIDGEGCFYIHRRPAGQHAGGGYHRTQDSFQAAFEVANTNEAVVQRCLAIAGVGSISRQDKDRRQPLFRWTVRSNEARSIAREIYPYLIAKQQQARIIVGILPSGKEAEAGWEALKLLHAGSETHVDFPVPASMFESGWYLRQDVIWSKPNPMPESVQDRCTKAHEYIFLLTKSPRYYFDADAIAEQVADSSIARLAQDVDAQEGSSRVPGKTNGTMKAVGRPQAKRASELAMEKGLTSAHIAAIRSVGIADTGKALVTTNGAGKNTEEVKRLAAEAKEALGGYYREFLMGGMRNKRSVWTVATQPFKEAHFATFPPELIEPCIKAGCPKDGTVLDPFGGAGTTALVADRLQRNSISIELNPAYAAIALKRVSDDAGMFSEVA